MASNSPIRSSQPHGALPFPDDLVLTRLSRLRELKRRIDEAERRERAAQERIRAALDRMGQPAAGMRRREPGGASRPTIVREAELPVRTQASPASTALKDAPPPAAKPPPEVSVEVEGPPPSPISERTVEAGYRRWIAPALLGVIVAVGLALRWLAAQESLFGDELFSYAVTTQSSLSGVFDQIELTEATPPLYYLLGWLSGKLGDLTTLIRAPSVLFGVAALPVVYLLGERFDRRSAGLIAAALIAVLPFTVFYGSEARAYALLMFLVALSTLALLRALDGERRLWWGVYWLAGALALYTHFVAALAIAVQGAWALWAERRQWRWILAVNASVALAFVPWLGMVDESANRIVAGVTRPLNVDNVVWATGDALFGHPFARFEEVPGLVSLLMLGLAAVIAAAAFEWVRRQGSGRSDANARPRSPRLRRELLLLALLVVVPPLLLLAYGIAADTSIYLPRNLIVVIPYLGVLVALGLAALPRRAMIAAATLAIAAALLGSVRMVLDHPRTDLRAAADEIERRAPPGTPVIEPPLFGNPERADSSPLGQDLAIYLDDEYPLSHDLKDITRHLRRQARGEDVYVVMPSPAFLTPVSQAVQAAGAEVNTARQFDGLFDVLVRSYRRK